MAQDSDQQNRRFPNLNNMSGGNSDDKNQKKSPRFNIYWIYGIIAANLNWLPVFQIFSRLNRYH